MTDAVIQISGGGRGFILGLRQRFVVTASHCLPRLPAPDPGAYLAQRTFEGLLGPLGGPCDVWAECLYADPVADLAVLGAPNRRHFGNAAKRFDALLDGRTPLRVAAVPLAPKPPAATAKGDGAAMIEAEWTWNGPGRLLALDGAWFDCRLRATRRALWIEEKAQGFAGGMSGSPIADPDGAAIGVLCSTGANPILYQQLPGWLLADVAEIGAAADLRARLSDR